MFVLFLTYLVAADEVDRWLEAHREFLRRCYAERLFLASGPQVPRQGGVILARGPRERLERLIADDPFTRHGVASYQVIEFEPKWSDPSLAEFLALD